MATFEKRPSGWRVKVRLSGTSVSKTFPTKAQASAWATEKEAEIISGKYGSVPDKQVSDLVIKYLSEVVIHKKGAREEEFRFNRLLGVGKEADGSERVMDPLGFVRLQYLGPEHIAEWRDRRLKKVSAASVLREWTSLSAMFALAVKEWRWLRSNPMTDVKRPLEPAPRTQVFTDDQVEKILFCAGYERDVALGTVTARVGAAMLFALETAMRAGEICGFTWDRVDLSRRLAHLNEIDEKTGWYKTKNSHARSVPLSAEAIRIIKQMELIREEGNPSVFQLLPRQLDPLFRKIRDRALVSDLHFHDTRRTALTRLAGKVDVMMLAKISGHRDLRILMNTYYAPDMGEVAALLD